MAIPLAETVMEFAGTFYKITKVAYVGASMTFQVDATAISSTSVMPASGAPAASLGSASSGEKAVTLAAGSASATVTVVTVHLGVPSGSRG